IAFKPGLRRGGRRMASPASHQARADSWRIDVAAPLSESPAIRLFSISRWRSFSLSNATSSFVYWYIADPPLTVVLITLVIITDVSVLRVMDILQAWQTVRPLPETSG